MNFFGAPKAFDSMYCVWLSSKPLKVLQAIDSAILLRYHLQCYKTLNARKIYVDLLLLRNAAGRFLVHICFFFTLQIKYTYTQFYKRYSLLFINFSFLFVKRVVDYIAVSCKTLNIPCSVVIHNIIHSES